MTAKATEFAAKADIAVQEKWGYIWATAGVKWTEKKQEDLKKKYESDPQRYASLKLSVKNGKKWIGKIVADCSGLVKWAAKELGISGIYHGSNSQFNKNCSRTGKIVPGMKLPVGALIFTGKEKGQHNHVGILTSATVVTEENGTVKGAIHTPISNKKWTYWGLMKGLAYDFIPGEEAPAEESEPAKVKHATLRRGAKGNDVYEMQQLLVKDGSTIAVDGIFGIGTLSAVKSFQKRHGLVVDGIVGPKTWAELLKI